MVIQEQPLQADKRQQEPKSVPGMSIPSSGGRFHHSHMDEFDHRLESRASYYSVIANKCENRLNGTKNNKNRGECGEIGALVHCE